VEDLNLILHPTLEFCFRHLLLLLLLQVTESILLLIYLIRIKNNFLCYRTLFFTISLSQRFNDVSFDIVHVTALTVDRKYPIVTADRVQTRYGETVLLSIRDPANLIVRDSTPLLLKVFLPKRYAQVFKDEDIASINDGTSVMNLINKGQCGQTNALILTVE